MYKGILGVGLREKSPSMQQDLYEDESIIGKRNPFPSTRIQKFSSDSYRSSIFDRLGGGSDEKTGAIECGTDLDIGSRTNPTHDTLTAAKRW